MSNTYMGLEPLADVINHCMDCNHVQNFENVNISLEDIRKHCTRCKRGKGMGIYKADAIITALRLKKDIEKRTYRGGRKSKIPESVRMAIKRQHDNKISIRNIAENTGYNKNTVNKILKEFKNDTDVPL